MGVNPVALVPLGLIITPNKQTAAPGSPWARQTPIKTNMKKNKIPDNARRAYSIELSALDLGVIANAVDYYSERSIEKSPAARRCGRIIERLAILRDGRGDLPDVTITAKDAPYTADGAIKAPAQVAGDAAALGPCHGAATYDNTVDKRLPAAPPGLQLLRALEDRIAALELSTPGRASIEDRLDTQEKAVGDLGGRFHALRRDINSLQDVTARIDTVTIAEIKKLAAIAAEHAAAIHSLQKTVAEIVL